MTLPTIHLQFPPHPEAPTEENWLAWLDQLPTGCSFLLAHLDQGVVWGRRDDGSWRFSSNQVPTSPPLDDLGQVQQLRAFGPSTEVLLWRTPDGWSVRQVVEDAVSGTPVEVWEEMQVLWGTSGRALDDGFTLLSDGAQGLMHALPIVVPAEQWGGGHRPGRLVVRHYLEPEPETGLARIRLSRLVSVTSVAALAEE